MKPFLCSICNYNTARKNDFLKHHKTKKHLLNEQKMKTIMETCEKTRNTIPKTPKKTLKSPICQYCEKSFSSVSHKNRHENRSCKLNPDLQDAKIQSMKAEFKKEKQQMMKQFEYLLTKVGNNTTNNNITQNNTININNYGSEDVSHLTNEYKISLLKIPFGMLQRLVKEIHFNKQKPENKNIYISNTRDNKVQIYQNGEWIYEKKKIAIRNLIDRKYYLMDDFYNEIQDSGHLNDFHKTNYKEFSRLYEEEEDKKLINSLSDDVELIILNNQK
jgi:hypothetical protein